jgi:FkbM family methyltransferase
MRPATRLCVRLPIDVAHTPQASTDPTYTRLCGKQQPTPTILAATTSVSLYSRALRPGSGQGSLTRRTAVRIANQALRRLPQGSISVNYELDGFSLHLPLSHPLPRILANDSTYLMPLKLLARALAETGSVGPAVDIGANVGDTAVMLAQNGLTNVVCVEGNPVFLSYLIQNVHRATERDWDFSVVDRFIGDDKDVTARVDTKGGTASIIRDDSAHGGGSIKFISPSQLLADLSTVSVLKIDTDGMDLEILSEILEASEGTIFDAVFTEFTPGVESLNNAFDLLTDVGLDRLYWFDHHGHLVCSCRSVDSRTVRELTGFGLATRSYFDVAAIRSGSDLEARYDALVGSC